MRQLHTEIEIGAPAELVWDLLLDFPSYASWNPFIRSISGAAKVGSTLDVQMHLPGRSPMTFHPKVLRVLTRRELRWKGRLAIPGLFDGEHWFMLYPLGNDRTRFVQGEGFSGILIPFLYGSLKPRTRDAFQRMNEALKELAEKRHAASLQAG